MRHEPPVLTDPTLGAAAQRASGPDRMADARDRRLSQDHAPRRGMSMILTKAFYRIFAVIAFGVGTLGAVITLNDLSMVLLGAPLMLLGFGCTVPLLKQTTFVDVGGGAIQPYFDREFQRDPAYYQTGELFIDRQMRFDD